MKYRYQILPEQQLVVEWLSGEVTLQDILEKTRILFSDPAFSSDFSGITDTRGAEAQLTKVELYAFSDMLKQSQQEGTAPWAIIATDPMLVALSQVYMRRQSVKDLITVVNTAQAAVDFIGKPTAMRYFRD